MCVLLNRSSPLTCEQLPLSVPPISFVVWDLDGTLTDSAPDIASALSRLLSEHGIPAIDPSSVKRLIGDGVPTLIRRGFREHGRELADCQLDAMAPTFMEYYQACAVKETRLYAGVSEALDTFKLAGVKQAVCTNKPAAISESILHTLGVGQYFDCVIGGDSTAAKKPDPLPLQVTAQRLNKNVADGLMIGDSSADSGAARAAGMRVAIVTYGYSHEPVSDLDCDFTVTDIDLFATQMAKSLEDKWADTR